MATIFIQRRDRSSGAKYAVLFRDPVTGKNRYFRTFNRKKDAEQAKNDLRNLLLTGRVPQKEKRFSPRTFGEVGEGLSVEWRNKVLERSLRETTLEGYCRRLDLLREYFGRKLMCEISREDILYFRRKRVEAFSNVSANRDLFIIKQVFQAGMKIGALSEDPTATIKYLSEKAHERNRYLLPRDLDRLIAAARDGKSGVYLPALIYLGAEHGASRQEALSLEWANVDFEFKSKGLIRFFRTKTERERTEILMPRTREALIAWREHQDGARKRKNIQPAGERVFCRMDGTPIERFDTAWRMACSRAGLKGFHFHDLRHTFCSNALLAGASLKDVKEMIGHSDLSMTDRYSHIATARMEAIQEELARHYAGGGRSGEGSGGK